MWAALEPYRPLLALCCPALAAGIVLLLADVPALGAAPGAPKPPARHALFVTLFGLAVAGTLCAMPTGTPSVRAMGGALQLDGLGRVGGASVCFSAALCAVLGYGALAAAHMATAEFLALLGLSTVGALCLALAGDVLTLFLGIELLSMGAYVLAGFRRSSRRSQEAALKYYLYGAFASAFMVFGMALLWGEVGRVLGEPTFSLRGIASAIEDGGTLHPLGWVGIALWMAGLLFKVGAVPFHMWTPDVYQGAPTASAAFFSSTVKLGSFVALVRIVLATVAVAPADARQTSAAVFAALALISIVVGNLLAMRQDRVKRLLAYSSVAHAGYALLGISALCAQGQGEGLQSLLIYLLAYAITATGCFAVVAALEVKGEQHEEVTIERMLGAARHHPLLAFVAVIGLFSLAGIPPTSGFLGKFVLLRAIAQAGYYSTATLAAIASAVGAYAYLRVLGALFFRTPAREAPAVRSAWLSGALCASALLSLGLGLAPEPLWAWAKATLAAVLPGGA